MFYITILGETLAYEVDQIVVVLPHEVEELVPSRGRDYCTLVTCTPYGINSHRLLVRGERVQMDQKTIKKQVASISDLFFIAIRPQAEELLQGKRLRKHRTRCKHPCQ